MSWVFHVRVLSWAIFWGSCYSQMRHTSSGQIPETSLNLSLSVGYSPNKAHLLRSHWPLRWSSWSATVSRQSSCEIYSWLPQTMHFCPSELRKYEPFPRQEVSAVATACSHLAFGLCPYFPTHGWGTSAHVLQLQGTHMGLLAQNWEGKIL